MRFIGAIFRGIWHALDALRKILHLLLLLVIFGAIAAAARAPLPIIPKHAALVLAPSGRIVEELSGDTVQRAIGKARGEQAPETRLKDIVDVLERARDDGRIKALVLDLENLTGANLSKLQEISAAIRKFRASGKKVLVWAPYMDQGAYYLAAQADEVYLDPYGGVVIDGYGRYRTYLKGAADKLEVDVNVFKVGDHKSAPEQYTRTDMSPEDREQSMQWIGVLWDAWKQDVARARKLEPEALQAYADQMAAGVRETKGDLAQYALQHGLVNGLETDQDFEQRMIGLVGEDEDTHSFNSVDDQSYLAHVRSEDVLTKHSGATIAVLVASGEIMDGEQSPGTVGGDTLSAMLRDARFDEDVEAVVLRIDSPGGSALASEQIRREVVALRKAGKPVVASMSGVAASGGYYIAAEADSIFAEPTTITGSIGVFGIIPTFQRTLGKIGITTDGVGTTVLSGSDRLDRSLTPEVKAIVQAGVEDFYRRFVKMVADARGRKPEEIESVAQGRVWAGKDAKAAGLVDKFGDVEAAIKEAARLAQLGKDYRVDWVSPKSDWRDMLGMRIGGAMLRFAAAAGLVPTRPTVPGLDALQAEVARLNRFASTAGPARPLYYCACSVE